MADWLFEFDDQREIVGRANANVVGLCPTFVACPAPLMSKNTWYDGEAWAGFN